MSTSSSPSLLPSLDLQGEVDYADQPTANIEWDRTASLGLNLSIPLYQGGGGVLARPREPPACASAA